ncbi:MAG: hypothetical protein O2887_04115 [Bacteroidetes bacterium]|nr:hypothetical protein [Bacteroidota bacterium]MDA1119671.1 hypothetical protein [Bacteroidota bacterium]
MASIFFFNVFLVFLMIKFLGLEQYGVSGRSGDFFLLPGNELEGFWYFTFGGLIANAVLISIAYFKLKEREV